MARRSRESQAGWVQLNVPVPTPLMHAIKGLAAEDGVSQAEFVRRAIFQFVMEATKEVV